MELENIQARDVLFYYNELYNFDFEDEYLDDLTILQLQELWLKENNKRFINIGIKNYDNHWDDLNVIRKQIDDILENEEIPTFDVGSGFGMGQRDFHWGFYNLKDAKKYKPLIKKAFSMYEVV